MNILFVVPWDQAEGGVTHVVASVARRLQDRGHRAFFLFPSEGWKYQTGTSRRGFPAIHCRLRDYPSQSGGLRGRVAWLSAVAISLPQLVRFGRANRIDLINVHYPMGGFALMVDLARKLEVPVVVSAHGSDLFPESGAYSDDGVNRLLAYASDVVVPSRTFLGSVLESYPIVREKTSCIYNGYDEREFDEPASPFSARRGPPTVLCIAAHTNKKGIDVLLRAAHSLSASQLQVRLVGDGPLRKDFERMAAALNVTDRVTFVGSTDRRGVFRELHNCDLVAMPSRSESFGLAALEAMVCGKPVVASSVGGLREIVDHNVTGLLLPPDDSDALAAALARLCSEPELRQRFGDAGRARSRRFSIASTTDQYETLFSRLVAGQNA
jgi:glycosyltransferase involved in cell wall biosynthesis